MMTADQFLYFVREKDNRERTVRLGIIDPAYTSGRPRVTFDGEEVVSQKAYPYLSSYVPAAGDRVMLLRAGSTWVVVGDIL